MENIGTARNEEQINAKLQGGDADLFREYMLEEAIQLKSAAGYKLIIEGLRRWKRSREAEGEAA